MRGRLILPLALTFAGCNGDGDGPVSLDTDGSQSLSVRSKIFDVVPPISVDLLFVIDDSASMADAQAALAQNLGAFTSVLERPEVSARYRVAVVRTSGPNCGQAVAPVSRSCLTRLDDFVIPEGREAPTADLRHICVDNCSTELLPLGPDDPAQSLVPLPAEPAWYEGLPPYSAPGSPTSSETLTCMALVGVNGCDYESPLDAMARAIEANDDPSSGLYNFLRPEAKLHVVIISDEDDCSLRDSSILDPEGGRVFWPASHQDDARAPSAACFRAGAACEATGSGKNLECTPVNRNSSGAASSPSNAVVTPLSEYLELLEGVRVEKLAHASRAEVSVALLNGVGDNGEPKWPAEFVEDPAFITEFGVAPGCTTSLPSANGEPEIEQREVAGPRLSAFTDAVTENNKFTLCSDDYSVALESTASVLDVGPRPRCMSHCGLDRAADTPGLQSDCSVRAEFEDGWISLSECDRDANGYLINPETNDYAMPDESTDRCYALMTDADGSQTPDPNDDLNDVCVQENERIELKVAVRAGAYARAFALRYELACLADLSTPDPTCSADAP